MRQNITTTDRKEGLRLCPLSDAWNSKWTFCPPCGWVEGRNNGQHTDSTGSHRVQSRGIFSGLSVKSPRNEPRWTRCSGWVRLLCVPHCISEICHWICSFGSVVIDRKFNISRFHYRIINFPTPLFSLRIENGGWWCWLRHKSNRKSPNPVWRQSVFPSHSVPGVVLNNVEEPHWIPNGDWSASGRAAKSRHGEGAVESLTEESFRKHQNLLLTSRIQAGQNSFSDPDASAHCIIYCTQTLKQFGYGVNVIWPWSGSRQLPGLTNKMSTDLCCSKQTS